LLTVSQSRSGGRIYVKATAAFIGKRTDAKSTDEHIESVAYAREAVSKKGMDEAQITGSASSYARKYALCGLLLIDDNKDPDTQNNTLDDYDDFVKSRSATIDAVKAALAENDYSTAKEAWHELTQEEHSKLWKAPTKGGCFTTEERAKMKSTEWSSAQ